MSNSNNAENHADIARKVYPDAEIEVIPARLVKAKWLRPEGIWKGEYCYVKKAGSLNGGHKFDLLEQFNSGSCINNHDVLRQKSDAFDTLEWYAKNIDKLITPKMSNIHTPESIMMEENPCEAIYKAALEVIKEGDK